MAEILVAAFNDHVFGLDAATGAQVWRFDFPSPMGGDWVVRIAVAGDVLYALRRGWLACIHVPTGRVMGQVQTAETVTRSPGTLLVAPDRIVLGTDNGSVQCFSHEGQLLWQRTFVEEGTSEVAFALGETVVQADRVKY
jgi:outer membrane protein assembly factor BamB